MNTKPKNLLTGLFLLSMWPLIAHANTDWHFEFAPYLWLNNTKTEVKTPNGSFDTTLTFGDIINNFEAGLEGHFEAGYQRWTFMFDFTYLKLEFDDEAISVSGHPVEFSDITQTMYLIDTGIFYRLWSSSDSMASFELLGGARYLGSHLNLSVNFGEEIDVTDNIDSTSPIVGARLKYDFSPKISTWLRGDVGGFDVDGMRNTWSATAGIGYALAEHTQVGIAYRALEFDYKKSEDTSINYLMYGPMIGLNFYF